MKHGPRPDDFGNDLFRVRVLEDSNTLIADTVRPLNMERVADRNAAIDMGNRIVSIAKWYRGDEPTPDPDPGPDGEAARIAREKLEAAENVALTKLNKASDEATVRLNKASDMAVAKVEKAEQTAETTLATAAKAAAAKLAK